MDLKTLSVETFDCVSCLKPIETGENICRYCHTPIGHTSDRAPFEIDYPEENIWVSAAENKPKFIVFFVVWFIHLPCLGASIMLSVNAIYEMSGITGFVFFWVGTFLAYFCVVMLYKVTKNYLFFEKKNKREVVKQKTLIN